MGVGKRSGVRVRSGVGWGDEGELSYMHTSEGYVKLCRWVFECRIPFRYECKGCRVSSPAMLTSSHHERLNRRLCSQICLHR